MRTKTLLLSALLGALGSVSIHAQTTNVYSLNAVGYINVTCPPGFNIVTCPLLTSPDNTVGTVLNNASGIYTHDQVYFFTSGAYGVNDTAENFSASPGLGTTTNVDGWSHNGTNVAAPGVGFWFLNNNSTNVVLTFVGTVPTGPITNTLSAGFNLVGSVVPMSGDLASNTISSLTNYNIGDVVYTYNPLNPPATAYTKYTSASGIFAGHGYDGQWTVAGDPIVPNVGQGFWYENNVGTTVEWVENYSVSQ
jgi:hypothetical protein